LMMISTGPKVQEATAPNGPTLHITGPHTIILLLNDLVALSLPNGRDATSLPLVTPRLPVLRNKIAQRPTCPRQGFRTVHIHPIAFDRRIGI
jgi:hypothetical protein